MTRSQASQRIASLLGALALFWCGGAFGQAEAPAEKKPLSFFGPEDGKLDMSDFLLNTRARCRCRSLSRNRRLGTVAGWG